MVGAAPAGDEHGRLPVELGRQPPQRAQEEPQRGALLLVAERDPERAFVRRRAATRRRAGAQHARSSAGKTRCISSRVASNDALRASRRPKNSSTKRRATCVESTRSAGAWNVPTLSEREWRSATDDALGANGSWTWTKSSGAVGQRLLDRARDVQRRRRDRAAARRRRAAAARRRRAPARRRRARTARRARIRRRDSRTSAGSCDGASTTTRWPARGQLARERARRTR